jgi:hypothetical protein
MNKKKKEEFFKKMIDAAKQFGAEDKKKAIKIDLSPHSELLVLQKKTQRKLE